MIEIKEYDNIYAEKISKLIIQNLLEVNSKDYGLEFVKKSIIAFTPEEIKKKISKRIKVFVALDDCKVIGTAGLDKSWYNDDGEYYILTVFVDVAHHKQGIGRMLIIIKQLLIILN